MELIEFLWKFDRFNKFKPSGEIRSGIETRHGSCIHPQCIYDYTLIAFFCMLFYLALFRTMDYLQAVMAIAMIPLRRLLLSFLHR